MTATNAPIYTEQDRPSRRHGHMCKARHLGASSRTCTQTRVMHTYRDTRARTHLGNPYKDARLCKTFTHGETSALVAHTHIHTTPRHPFLPTPNPIPSLPLPSHLPGPIPSIKLQKQVSQQPGRGKVSVCLLPAPTPPGPALPAPLPTPAQDAYTSAAETWHMKETRASSQPHT